MRERRFRVIFLLALGEAFAEAARRCFRRAERLEVGAPSIDLVIEVKPSVPGRDVFLVYRQRLLELAASLGFPWLVATGFEPILSETAWARVVGAADPNTLIRLYRELLSPEDRR
jgi:hypothetical protein